MNIGFQSTLEVVRLDATWVWRLKWNRESQAPQERVSKEYRTRAACKRAGQAARAKIEETI
jgi:hypothetical protein